MKHLLTLSLCLLSICLFSQTKHTDFLKTQPAIDKETPDWAVLMYSKNPHIPTLDSLYRLWRETHPTDKTVHSQNYKHWRRSIEQYVDNKGFISRLAEFDARQLLKSEQPKAEGLAGNWSIVGPVESYDQSNRSLYDDRHANIYSMDVYEGDANILYCGTESGGVYKTTDKGLNWTFVTANYAFKSVQAIEIHPTNSNIVFAASSATLFRTTDGGTTWESVATGSGINDIAIHPSNPNIVLLGTNAGIYRSTTGGNNGSFSSVTSSKCFDIEFKSGNGSVVFALVEDAAEKMCKFYKSTDDGASFTVRSTGWLSLNTTDHPLSNRVTEGGRLAVTPANSNRIYAYLAGATKSTDGGHIGLWSSDDAGETWTLKSPRVGAPYSAANPNLANSHPDTGDGYSQGFYNLAIMASPSNADLLVVGNLAMYRSTDGGTTMTQASRDLNIHSDMQGMVAKGSDAWVCNDGGMVYSSDFFGINVQVRQNGIIASEYWGFGQGWNQDIMVGGRYHNGNAVLSSTYPAGKSFVLGGGEAPTGYVNPSTNVAYFSDLNAKVLPTDFNGVVSDQPKWAKYPNQAYYASYSSDVEFDPRYYKHIYMGEGTSLWKSTDNGVAFSQIKDFNNGSSECAVRDIEIARTNPSVIYVHVKTAYSGAALYRSADGGATWATKAFPSTPDKRHGAISLSATDENKLWVIFSNGSNGNKVYQTNDGGTNWVNITSSVLNGHALHTVLNQAGTDDVYVGTDQSVFRYSGGTWSTFNTGLPSYIKTLLLKGYYRGNKLRLASFSHGIWESDFGINSPPVAQPMVDKNSSICSSEPFYFDDYSVAKSNATYAWTFSPTPQYVSSSTARNPTVIFGADGTYSASLTVTDDNGTSSKTVNNMVTIASNGDCETSTVRGTAMSNATNGDYMLTPAIDLGSSTDQITLMAWIRPNAGTQSSYATILSCSGVNVNLNFRDNNELGLHWNDSGASYGWASGLTVPTNEWAHVAMVANGTNMKLYLNGQEKTLTTYNPPTLDLSNRQWYIGNDRGNTDRTFKGLMDEVCFYNRALTANEIREQMHLMKNPATDATLKGYFQFNESGSTIYNKAVLATGALVGGATKVTSKAPVGVGTSSRLAATTAGATLNFVNQHLTIQLPNSGTLPNADLVVIELNVAPDQAPSGGTPLSTKYWIVNNLGLNGATLANQTFSQLAQITFSDLGSFATPNPSNYKLYKRKSGNDGATWGASIDVADIWTNDNNNTLTFNANNNVTSFSQFTINNEAVLSVELLDFKASLKNQKVDLTWQIADETTVKHYEIERSLDGKNFDFLKKQDKGNANVHPTSYIVHDLPPQYSVVFYRLKIVENDGSFTYSPIRSVNFESDKKTDFKIYPNPATNVLNIQFNAEHSQVFDFELINAVGQIVHSYRTDSKVGNNHLFLNTHLFAKGLYSLRIKLGNSVVVEKVVID
jgi:photosystem II stability/assembly factor-like uncharacterized protein